MATPTHTVGNNNGNGTGSVGLGVGVSLGWPTERWVGLIVLTALALLILIRFGFRGVGFSANVGARASV